MSLFIINNKKKIVLTSSFALVMLTALVLGGFYITNNRKVDTETSNQNTNNVNYSPPTEVEKSAGDERKSEIYKSAESNDINPESLQVNMVIVDAAEYDNNIEVRSFASNVTSDGKCTIIFTKDSESITKEVPAYADASTTPCINLSVSRSEFKQSGEWQLQVKYVSKDGKHQGSASSKIIMEKS